jgi:hypothetical protein
MAWKSRYVIGFTGVLLTQLGHDLATDFDAGLVIWNIHLTERMGIRDAFALQDVVPVGGQVNNWSRHVRDDFAHAVVGQIRQESGRDLHYGLVFPDVQSSEEIGVGYHPAQRRAG